MISIFNTWTHEWLVVERDPKAPLPPAAQVDRFLDESLMASRDTIFIIHGHGTGALRTAVRSHLAGHGSIQNFRAGEPNEGGDGVTVAFLK